MYAIRSYYEPNKSMTMRWKPSHRWVWKICHVLISSRITSYNVCYTKLLRLVIGDAFHFLSETNTLFDLIILDVFAIDGAPAPIFHAETYLQLKRCLTEAGQVIINLLPRTENERIQVLTQMKTQLGCVQSLQVAEYRNHLIWSTPATRT